MCDISIPLVRPLLLPTIVIAAYGRDGPKYSCSARLIRPIAIVKNARVFFTLRTKETINAVSRLSFSLSLELINKPMIPFDKLELNFSSTRFEFNSRDKVKSIRFFDRAVYLHHRLFQF